MYVYVVYDESEDHQLQLHEYCIHQGCPGISSFPLQIFKSKLNHIIWIFLSSFFAFFSSFSDQWQLNMATICLLQPSIITVILKNSTHTHKHTLFMNSVLKVMGAALTESVKQTEFISSRILTKSFKWVRESVHDGFDFPSPWMVCVSVCTFGCCLYALSFCFTWRVSAMTEKRDGKRRRDRCNLPSITQEGHQAYRSAHGNVPLQTEKPVPFQFN